MGIRPFEKNIYTYIVNQNRRKHSTSTELKFYHRNHVSCNPITYLYTFSYTDVSMTIKSVYEFLTSYLTNLSLGRNLGH